MATLSLEILEMATEYADQAQVAQPRVREIATTQREPFRNFLPEDAATETSNIC